MFNQAKKEQKTDETEAKIYRNYASGLLFGGLGIGIWAIYHNIYDSDPYVWWSNALTIPNLPTTFISNNFLILISFFVWVVALCSLVTQSNGIFNKNDTRILQNY